MWKLLPPLNLFRGGKNTSVLIPTGVLLQPPCSYHIDRCPSPSRGHNSPGWQACAGASGRPRTPGQPLWSGSAPGWWTSSGPWCKSSPASPCVVGGSWGCSSLRVSKRITLLFFCSTSKQHVRWMQNICLQWHALLVKVKKSIYLTSRVPGFDLGFQLQRDVRHLFVGRVASASPFRFFRGVTLEVNKCHQTVAAGLTASCGWHNVTVSVRKDCAGFVIPIKQALASSFLCKGYFAGFFLYFSSKCLTVISAIKLSFLFSPWPWPWLCQ